MLISLLAMVLCFVLIWCFTSNWGKVNVNRMKFSYGVEAGGNGNYEASYILYAPDTASEVNPGKLVVVFHGGTSNSFAVKNYAMEFSRRGYVVVTADLPTTGYSDSVGETSEGAKVNGLDNSHYAVGQKYEIFLSALETQLKAMTFVDQESGYAAIGFSNGATVAATMVSLFPEDYIIAGNLTSSARQFTKTAAQWGLSGYFGINAAGTGTATEHKGRTEEFYDGGISDKITKDGVREITIYTKHSYVHVLMPDSNEMVGGAVYGLTELMPSGVDTINNPYKLVYWWGEIFSLLGLIAMVFFVVNFTGVLLQTEFFSSLKHEKCVVAGLKPKTTNKKLISWGIILAEFGLFVLVYRFVGGKVKYPFTNATPLWFNNLMPYLMILAAYQIGKFLLWHFRLKKSNEGNWVTYGLAWEGDWKYNLSNIGKCLILALFCAVVFFGLAEYMNINLGVNYQFMVLTISSLTPKKMAATPVYILSYLVIFLGAHMTAYCMRNEDCTTSNWKTLLDALKGATITIAPILVYCFKNFLSWKELIGARTNGVADRLYGYVIIVYLIGPLHAFLYKKTKSVWPGIFICSVMMTFMICANYPLSLSYFV